MIKCPECGRKFKDKAGLAGHRRQVHGFKVTRRDEIGERLERIEKSIKEAQMWMGFLDVLSTKIARDIGYDKWKRKGWSISSSLKESEVQHLEDLMEYRKRFQDIGVDVPRSLDRLIKEIEKVKELPVEEEEKQEEKGIITVDVKRKDIEKGTEGEGLSVEFDKGPQGRNLK